MIIKSICIVIMTIQDVLCKSSNCHILVTTGGGPTFAEAVSWVRMRNISKLYGRFGRRSHGCEGPSESAGDGAPLRRGKV
jgi:hypothetical protein